MDFENIDSVLEKYWACETSLEEEQMLQNFFTHKNLPEKYTETAALFSYYEAQRNIESKEALEAVSVNKFKQQPKGKMRSMFYNMSRIAAGILVIAVATFLIRAEYLKSDKPDPVLDSFNDPMIAFEETKKALMLISENFNKGKREAQKINMLNEATEKVSNQKQEN
jgi:GTP-sensing pleiotropic transcriptional regulator CodY